MTCMLNSTTANCYMYRLTLFLCISLYFRGLNTNLKEHSFVWERTFTFYISQHNKVFSVLFNFLHSLRRINKFCLSVLRGTGRFMDFVTWESGLSQDGTSKCFTNKLYKTLNKMKNSRHYAQFGSIFVCPEHMSLFHLTISTTFGSL